LEKIAPITKPAAVIAPKAKIQKLQHYYTNSCNNSVLSFHVSNRAFFDCVGDVIHFFVAPWV